MTVFLLLVVNMRLEGACIFIFYSEKQLSNCSTSSVPMAKMPRNIQILHPLPKLSCAHARYCLYRGLYIHTPMHVTHESVPWKNWDRGITTQYSQHMLVYMCATVLVVICISWELTLKSSHVPRATNGGGSFWLASHPTLLVERAAGHPLFLGSTCPSLLWNLKCFGDQRSPLLVGWRREQWLRLGALQAYSIKDGAYTKENQCQENSARKASKEGLNS